MPVVPVLALVALALVGAAVAWWLRRGEADDPEQGASWSMPAQLVRTDFERPEAPWLVVVFSSATCLACRGTFAKAQVLASDSVAVQDVEVSEAKDLHDRYRIEAVPATVIADAEGVVRRSFVGEPTATDLWAALADLREPGSVPESCTGGEPVRPATDPD